VGVLGEFAPPNGTRERLGDYKRVMDAMEDLHDPNLDYHITVKLTNLGLTLNEDLCRKNLEEIILYAQERKWRSPRGLCSRRVDPSPDIGPIRGRRSAFRGETAGGPNADLTTDIIRRGFHTVVLVTP